MIYTVSFSTIRMNSASDFISDRLSIIDGIGLPYIYIYIYIYIECITVELESHLQSTKDCPS